MEKAIQLLLLVFLVRSGNSLPQTVKQSLPEGGFCSAIGMGGTNVFDLVSPLVGFPQHLILQEVAFGKKTYASPRYRPSLNTYLSDHAVDGNDATYYHSDSLMNPWWLVDLGEEKIIHQILLLSRRDCCPERLHDVEIRLGHELRTDGNFDSYELLQFYKGPYSAAEGFLQCSFFKGVKGRFLSIQIVNSLEFLQLHTVRVYAKRKSDVANALVHK